MATVKCSSCSQILEVEDAYRDWTVRCPHCGAEFVPAAVDAPDRDRTPRRRPRDDYDDRDHYARDRDDYDEPDRRTRARREALRVVSAPALWLEICGWVTALLSIGLAALFVLLGVEMANNPNGNQDDGALFVFLGCGAGVFGVPYGVAMAVGARKMRNLTSHGWALAGGILGVAAFSVFGCWGLIPAAIGAWALVALNQPVVRAAFDLSARDR